MSDKTYSVEQLIETIPTASFKELKLIMEVLRLEKTLYGRYDFNYINRLISARLIELGREIIK